MARARQVLDEDHYDLEKVKDRILEYLAVRKLREERAAEAARRYPRQRRRRRGRGRGGRAGAAAERPRRDPGRPRRAGADPLLRRPAGRRQDQPRPVDRAGAGPQVRAHLAGRHPRRGGDPRPPPHLHRRDARAASSRRCGARRRATRCSCWTRSTRSAPTGAAIPPRRCSKCSTRRRTTPSSTTTWACPSTSRRCCSSPPPTRLDTIPAPLLDRMEVLPLSGYTEEEKVQHRAAVPRAQAGARRTACTPEEVSIADEAIRAHRARLHARGGVRNLEREIATVCRKVARDVAEGKVSSSRG